MGTPPCCWSVSILLWKRLHEVSHKEKRYDVIGAFNSTSRYLDDLRNIDNIQFEQMVHTMYPVAFQLNKANASDTEGAFLY